MVVAERQLNGTAPFTEAHVCLIEGSQGSGKTNTAVAKVFDNYDRECVRIFCREVLHIDCVVKGYDRQRRIAKIKYGGETKIFRIPEKYKMQAPMRIFCNFHLFGIPYSYCPSFEFILQGLRSGLIRDGWLIVDEYYVGGNARECMTALGKELEKQSFQFRKMQLNVIIVTPMARLIDWTMRTVPTEHILCEYNSNTRKITLTITKKGQHGKKEISYPAWLYWKYYQTNEKVNA